MSTPENVQKLDERIASAVRSALSGLRSEMQTHLKESTTKMGERLDDLESALPSSFVASEDLRSFADEASATARRDAMTEFRDALTALDAATSQSEVLKTLLEQAGRFSSRSALFLVDDVAIRGWGEYGFDSPEGRIGEVVLSRDDDSTWSKLYTAGGTIELNTAESAAICSRLEAPLPERAVLIPLVLRDRIAAALYADQEDNHPVLEALQSLAFVAAQSLETLPFRERSSTPTLAIAGANGDSSSGLAPWGAAAAVAAATAGSVAGFAVPDVDVEDGDDEQDPAEEAAAQTEEPLIIADAPMTVAEEAAALMEEAALTDQEDDSADDLFEEPGEVSASEAISEAASDEPAEQVGDKADEPATDVAGAASETGAIDIETEPPALSLVEDSVEPAFDPEVDSGTLAFPAKTRDPVVEEPVEAQAQDEVTLDTEPPQASTAELSVVDIEPVGDETVLVQTDSAATPLDFATTQPVPTAPSVFEPPPPPAQPPSPAAGRSSAEVVPPADIQGPGSAFVNSDEDEALHQEGRRLARLLVSEIRLYHEEQVEEGKRNRDIYRRLKDDIDRSRQMYEERVNPRIRDTSDHFSDELVRILADGDADLLGM